jgi:hypothetical protein
MSDRRYCASALVALGVAVALLVPSIAEAQERALPESGWLPTVGLKVGMISPTLESDNPANNFTTWNAPYLALAFGGRQNARFEVATEVGVSRKGARNIRTMNRGYSYWEFLGVEVPVLMRLNIGLRDRSVRGFIVAGPSFDFRIRHAATIADNPPHSLHRNTPFFGWNAVAGGGVEWRRWSIEGRWHHGVRSLTEQADAFMRSQMHTRTATLVVGARIWQ